MNLGPYQLNEIYTGDCRELAKAIPDESVDLILTSPPYDSLRQYNGYSFNFEGIAQQLGRVLKPGGVIVWIVADQTVDGSETGTSFRQALYFMSLGLNLHDTMIYEVMGTGAKGSHYAYWQAFEYMFIFSKGKPKTINLLKDRKNIKAGHAIGPSPKADQVGSRKKDADYIIQEYGIRTNIWRYHVGANGDDITNHPAPFPESLARDHILSWSNAGDLVLDPMCGSGTTCKMAVETGRPFIGFEISEEYTQIARRRTKVAQPPLFTLEPQQAELFA